MKSTYLNGRPAVNGSSPRADKATSAEARILALAAMLMTFTWRLPRVLGERSRISNEEWH